ncbi:hypothetical protein BC941DRAFT_8433 [Chlamydoabsidia padenii]|nr:hypothetical protein BC941DRAFT_8433 [Chlamydoabsidia padenii]
MPSAPPPPVLQQMETTQSQEQPITEQQQASPSLSSGSKSSGVNCVCDHPTDDEKMMVQCDECQLWLHLDCVGTNDGVLDDIYNCPRCTDRLGKRRRLDPSPQRQDVASLIFDQLNNTPTSGLSVDQQPSTVPENKPTPPVWDDLLDAGQTTTTPSVSNNKNHNNDVNMWGMSTADIPSLLYSDAMTSTLDDDLPYLMDLPSSDLSPHDLPPTDWFQFANFDDDFHCDDSQTTQ